MNITPSLLNRMRNALPAFLLALLPLSAHADSGRIESGHSAMWINPERNGEGWILEILPNDGAALYWYTSDDEGKPRWIISNGGGSIVRGEDGDRILFPELVTGHGGRFAQNVPASDVTLEAVGTAEIRFSDCNSGEISFDAYGKAATYPLTRLSRTMGAGCSPLGGVPGEAIQSYAGTSGTWFDVESNGGPVFTLQWLTNGSAILFWFAYDPEGKPFWAAGLGQYENELLIFPELHSISGGRFSEDYPDEQTVEVPWGSIEMYFTCDDATASYNATEADFGFGTFHLKPLTRLAQPTCPYVKPKLTDLYDIVLIELPEEPAIPPTGPELGSRNLVFPGSVANNGTIAATRKITNASVRHLPVRLTLANMAWVDLLENWLEVLPYPLISAQGDAILATANPASTHLPMIFKDGNSNYLPDMMYPANVLGASDDFRYAVGRGYRPLPEEEDANIIAPWIWDDAHGHATLPTTDELGAPFALVVSNDGNRVVGRHDFVSREIPGQGGAWDIGGNFGVYWNNRQAPQIIRGENGEYLGSPVACDANCDIIFGNVSWQRYDNHLRGQSNHSWYWNPETGRSGSLGALQPTEDNPEGWAYDLWAVSNSGSLAVGLYHSPEMTGQLPDGSKSYDGLIWSQNTGFVQLSELLAETGQNLDWPAVYAHDISPNGEYILLATAEIFTAPGQIGVPSFSRLALLRLTPKAQ